MAFFAVTAAGLGAVDFAQRQAIVADRVMIALAVRRAADLQRQAGAGVSTWQAPAPGRRSI